MPVRIRLQRKGAKHMPFYRIVVSDSRSPRDGRAIDQLGYYDPLKEPVDIKVDTEKVLDWLGKGAKPTETVKSLLSRVGIMETWHHVRQGKLYDEVRHIEEDARKRMEAAAAMQKRAKDDTKAEKKTAGVIEEEQAKPAASDTGLEATGAEEGAAEPAAAPAAEETAAAPEEAPAAEETAAAPEEAPAAEETAAAPEEAPAAEETAAEPEKTEE